MKQLREDLRKEIESALVEIGLELFELSVSKKRGQEMFTVIIDRIDNYVDLDDCEKASRAIGSLLDKWDLFDSKYMLEVSSPGLERKLRGPSDYKRFEGETVKIIMSEPVEKRAVFIGTLKLFDETSGEITILERDAKKDFRLKSDKIKEARLYLEV